MQKVIHGNCLDVLRRATPNSIDAIVTDPPYGLSFMGKKWDYDVPSVEIWQECLRVLKPGGYLLAFAGTRTQHRMAVRIEDAGFEIRDMIAWVYGSGFPKSLNIGKAVDKMQGNEREDAGEYKRPDGSNARTNVDAKAIWGNADGNDQRQTKGTSEWEGWGTALKPALEPITMARKPLDEKTVAENCLKWGTGGINIDESRVAHNEPIKMMKAQSGGDKIYGQSGRRIDMPELKENGRFPANLIHDNSEEVRECFPETKSGSGGRSTGRNFGQGENEGRKDLPRTGHDDSGNASRFFKSILYYPKASKSERNKGCEELEEKVGIRTNAPRENEDIKTPTRTNNHPTVKPIALMEYLVKLVSREGALVLDPFAGSGSTLIACKNTNRGYVGIEMDEEYIKIIEARLASSI